MKTRRNICLMLAVFMVAAMFSFSALTVSANDDGENPAASPRKPAMVLDYVQETIWINHEDPQGRTLTDDLTLNGNVVLLYALKIKGTTDNDLEKAKWLPTYSGAINVSRYVPRRAGSTPYIIAFRWSDQMPKNENVTTVELKARQAIMKGDVWYDTDNQYIIAKDKGFEVRIGDDVWYGNDGTGWGELIGNDTGSDDSIPDKDRPLWLPMNFLPTGGVAVARKLPIEEYIGPDGTVIEGQFASSELRIKLPRPSKAVEASKISIIPKGGRVSAAYFKGFSDKMEVFLGEVENNGQRTEIWEPVKRNMSITEFDQLFKADGKADGSGKDTSRSDKYSFRVRNRANRNQPASLETVLEFGKAVYDEALADNSANGNNGQNNET